MTTGSKRRVLIAPESKYSALGDLGETVDFEIEVVEVLMGSKAALFQARSLTGSVASGVLNILFWYYAVQTVLELTGVIQPGQTMRVDGPTVDVTATWAIAAHCCPPPPRERGSAKRGDRLP